MRYTLPNQPEISPDDQKSVKVNLKIFMYLVLKQIKHTYLPNKSAMGFVKIPIIKRFLQVSTNFKLGSWIYKE